MKKIALIPLRGGSKSIPKKNIMPIAGKPLCAWVLESATASNLIDEVYVSTDSNEIAQTVEALDLGVKILMRPPELATDEASTESVILHFIKHVELDVLVTIQATSPLLSPMHLDEALRIFLEHPFQSMLSAVRVKRFFWNDDGVAINYDPLCRPRRQDFKGTLTENGAFYITDCSVLKKYRCRLGGQIGVYEMPEETLLEIDEPSDWDAVEKILMKVTY